MAEPRVHMLGAWRRDRTKNMVLTPTQVPCLHLGVLIVLGLSHAFFSSGVDGDWRKQVHVAFTSQQYKFVQVFAKLDTAEVEVSNR